MLELYEKLELPHDPIDETTLIIVENALRAAWEFLREHPPKDFNLSTAHEDIITHELYEILYDEVFCSGLVAGFDNQFITVVTRESKVRNYDGSELDKMPDLLVGYTHRSVFRRTQDWLFIECKPVGKDHPVGSHYCDKGLIRFVDGRYAWAMTEALMIGYAKPKYTILSEDEKTESLDKALRKRPTTIPTLRHLTKCSCDDSAATEISQAVHSTQHKRIKKGGEQLRYKETSGVIPPIIIRHLWLKRD